MYGETGVAKKSITLSSETGRLLVALMHKLLMYGIGRLIIALQPSSYS
jgi:hypothetical protein